MEIKCHSRTSWPYQPRSGSCFSFLPSYLTIGPVFWYQYPPTRNSMPSLSMCSCSHITISSFYYEYVDMKWIKITKPQGLPQDLSMCSKSITCYGLDSSLEKKDKKSIASSENHQHCIAPQSVVCLCTEHPASHVKLQLLWILMPILNRITFISESMPY